MMGHEDSNEWIKRLTALCTGSSSCKLAIRFHLNSFKRAIRGSLKERSDGMVRNRNGYKCLFDKSGDVDAYETYKIAQGQ